MSQEPIYLNAQTKILALLQHEGGFWSVTDMYKRTKYNRNTILNALKSLKDHALVQEYCDINLRDMRTKYWKATET